MKLTVETMTENLLDGWSMTTPLQQYRGLAWYPQAHDFAYVIGRGNVVMGAGLLAAMSPNKGWDNNRLIAVNASFGIFGGQVGNAIGKAQAIYNGADPESVLPMHKKTGHFYRNILNPFDVDFVTIDRHAIRAATLDWDNGNPRVSDRQYGDFVLAYQKAAANVGIVPSAFQAVLWVWARER